MFSLLIALLVCLKDGVFTALWSAVTFFHEQGGRLVALIAHA